MEQHMEHVDSAARPRTVTFHIDRVKFTVPAGELTGAQLRRLPEPDIAADLDLWLEVPDGEDLRVHDHEVVVLKSGMHFFTAPHTINPGRAR
jgi:hypothetical protein